MQQKYIEPQKSARAGWIQIANWFDLKWNFPHCLGAIDGKHVIIQAQLPRGGSEYFNYKKTHSIVLLAVCNASYEFILLHVGDNGRQSDGGDNTNSKIGFAIDNNLLDFPPAENYGTNKMYPYVFVIVADDKNLSRQPR